MQASAASAAASGGWELGLGRPRRRRLAGPLMQLMRSKWDVTKAVRATLEALANGGSSSCCRRGKSHPQRPAQPVQPRHAPKTQDELVCGICFDAPEAPEALRAMSCGHAYCDDCWGGTWAPRWSAAVHASTTPARSRRARCRSRAKYGPPSFLARGGKSSARLHPRAAFLCRLQQPPRLLPQRRVPGTAAAYAQPRAPPEIVRCRCGRMVLRALRRVHHALAALVRTASEME